MPPLFHARKQGLAAVRAVAGQRMTPKTTENSLKRANRAQFSRA